MEEVVYLVVGCIKWENERKLVRLCVSSLELAGNLK